MGETREGGRRCGQVRFEVSAPEMLTMVCHCRGCQRMSGGAFALGLTVPAAHSFPGFPPNDAWPGLIAAYGQAQAAAG